MTKRNSAMFSKINSRIKILDLPKFKAKEKYIHGTPKDINVLPYYIHGRKR